MGSHSTASILEFRAEVVHPAFQGVIEALNERGHSAFLLDGSQSEQLQQLFSAFHPDSVSLDFVTQASEAVVTRPVVSDTLVVVTPSVHAEPFLYSIEFHLSDSIRVRPISCYRSTVDGKGHRFEGSFEADRSLVEMGQIARVDIERHLLQSFDFYIARHTSPSGRQLLGIAAGLPAPSRLERFMDSPGGPFIFLMVLGAAFMAVVYLAFLLPVVPRWSVICLVLASPFLYWLRRR